MIKFKIIEKTVMIAEGHVMSDDENLTKDIEKNYNDWPDPSPSEGFKEYDFFKENIKPLGGKLLEFKISVPKDTIF